MKLFVGAWLIAAWWGVQGATLLQIESVNSTLGNVFLIANAIVPTVKIALDVIRSSTTNRWTLVVSPIIVAVLIVCLIEASANRLFTTASFAQAILVGIIATAGAFTLSRIDRAADTAEEDDRQWLSSGMARYRAIMHERLTEDELNDLCFDLGCPCGDLTKGDLIRCILTYVKTQRKKKELTQWISSNRTDIQLPLSH